MVALINARAGAIVRGRPRVATERVGVLVQLARPVHNIKSERLKLKGPSGILHRQAVMR
jgi:hypothetical protein